MDKTRPPFAIRALLGVGAFLSLSFFVPFILLALDLKDAKSFIILGVILIAIAFSIYKSVGENPVKFSSVYFNQISLIIMIAGKASIVFGVALLQNSSGNILTSKSQDLALASLGVTLLTYFFYRIPLERFLTVLCTLSLIVFMFIDLRLAPIYLYALIGLFFTLWLVFDYIMVLKEDFFPAKHAMIATLIGITILFTIDIPYTKLINKSALTALYASFLTIYAFIIMKKEQSSLEIQIIILASIAVLAYLSTSGIILALLIFMMGIERQDKKYSVLGSLLIAAFLFIYYYSLELSLLHKSVLLAGSGVVLLAGALYMRLRGFHHAQ